MHGFEVHLTVGVRQERELRQYARARGVSVHLFTNIGGEGWSEEDLMTSEVVWRTDLATAVHAVDRRTTDMAAGGLHVLRRKLEVDPLDAERQGWEVLYHETHMRTLGGPSLVGLRSVDERGGQHVTVRTRGRWAWHRSEVDRCVRYLSWAGIQVVGKPDTEACVWDSAPERDAVWEKRSCTSYG